MKLGWIALAAASAWAAPVAVNATTTFSGSYDYGVCTQYAGFVCGRSAYTFSTEVVNGGVTLADITAFSGTNTSRSGNYSDTASFTLADLSTFSGSVVDGVFTTYALATINKTPFPFSPIGARCSITATSPGAGLPASVPEPATWAMFIGGFGLIGSAMRRRQKVGTTFA